MDVIEVLEKLISYDTRTNETTPGKYVKSLLETEFEPILRSYGFTIQYFHSNGHYSLFAEKLGKSPAILYSGHVDVVPWDDRWITDPTQMIKKNENGEALVIGRGVSDMKSGIAALICALPEIAKSESTLYFAITGDEEIGGEDGTRIICDHLATINKLPDYVITADASGMEIITRRRNVFDLIIKSKKTPKVIRGNKQIKKYQTDIVSSLTAHAAYYKKKVDKHATKIAVDDILSNGYLPISINGSFVKVNVVPNSLEVEYLIPDEAGEEIVYDEGLLNLFKLIKSLMEIDFETQAESDYGINSTANVIDDDEKEWRLQVDIRAMLDEVALPLDRAIDEILNKIDWKFDIEVTKSIGYIATPNDSPLVTATTEILSDLGYPDKPAERGGATDGRFFSQHGIQTIDIGAIGWNVHGPNETATEKSIRDLVLFFEKSASFIYDKYNQYNQ